MNIYVGNLPYSVDEQDLRDMFAPYGEVESVNIIIDRDSGRSKGFGFVEMSDDSKAQEAIRDLDGKNIKGDRGDRAARVNEARPRRPRREQRRNDW
ncbi:MAG: RNA recognition motif domain-containing protein [Ardenticatenaceae bacterium]